MYIFLEAKGIRLDCSDADLIKLGLSAADGSYGEKEILEFIIKHEI
jgi:hypothetical protein